MADKKLPKDQNDMNEALRKIAEERNQQLFNPEYAGGNMGFFNKGLANTLGAPMDMAGGAANELRRFSDFTAGLMEKGSGMTLPRAGQADYSNQFGGSNSFRRGMANIGAETPDRAPVTLAEQVFQGTGELVPYAFPALGLASGSKKVVDASSALGKVMTAGDFLAPEQSGLSQASQQQASQPQMSPYEGSYQANDGSMVGQVRGGGSRVMTPLEAAAFDAQMKAGTLPYGAQMGEYNPVAGTQGSVSQPLQQALPRAGQGSPQENFANFDPSSISPEAYAAKLDDAVRFAARYGYDFNEDTGYTQLQGAERDQAMSDYANSDYAKQAQQEQNSYRARGLETDAQGRMRDPKLDAAADAEARATGNPTFSEASAAREARIASRPDFNDAYNYDSAGNKVVATAGQRNIKNEARAAAKMEGLSGSERTAFINNYTSKAENEIADRESKLATDELNRKIGEQNLAEAQAKLQQTLNPGVESTLDAASMLKINDFMKDRDVQIDPETNLPSRKTPSTWGGMGGGDIKPIPQNDQFYVDLMKTPEGQEYLNASIPKDVTGLKNPLENQKAKGDNGYMYVYRNGKWNFGTPNS
jgi:hypothetical protein